MATGIHVPITSRNGRMALSTGDDYIESLIINSLGSGESTNPFQDGLGLSESIIFSINDGLTEGDIRKRTQAVFKSLEDSQLAEFEDVKFRTETSEKFMDVFYRNLETGVRVELEVPLSNS